MILLPTLEDVMVKSERHSWKMHSRGTYSQSLQYLPTIGKANRTNKIGDVLFISDHKTKITFCQISDPQRLASVVKSVKKQNADLQIGGMGPDTAKRNWSAETYKWTEKSISIKDTS